MLSGLKLLLNISSVLSLLSKVRDYGFMVKFNDEKRSLSFFSTMYSFEI